MSFDINYDIPTIITKRNVDSMENPIGVKLLEKKQVMDNHSCIVLSQIPDENYRITIEGFNEVFNSDELGNNNFYVSYSQGVVHFSPRYHGKTVVIEYYGIGYELISASRVFYKYDKRGNVIETLEEILDNAKEQLELIKTLGDSVRVIEKLEMDLENGKVLHDNLENDIEVGTPLQENLHSDIVEAKKWKDQLHQDVTDGKALQPLLQKTVDDAEDVKVRLDKSIADAQEDIAIIEATGNKEILIQSSQWTLRGDIYEKEITHDLNSENLHVTAKNSNTKEAVTIGYKIIDKTRILLKSDEPINMSIILSASYYHAVQNISDDICQEVVKSRKGETSLDVKITKIDEQLETIDNELNDIYINVKTFGAKGNYNPIDGSGDDDTEAINSVINYVLSNNISKKIYFPCGYYKITNKLTTINSSINIVGDSFYRTRIYYDNSNENLIEIDSAQKVIIDNISFHYIGQGQNIYAIKDLATHGGFDINLKNVYIQDFPYGVKLKKIVYSCIDIHVTSVDKVVNLGLDLATDTNDYANGVEISSRFVACNIGLKLGNGVNINLKGKGFEQNKTSDIVFIPSNGISSSVLLDNVYFENHLTSHIALDGSNGKNQFIEFNNCYFRVKTLGELKNFKNLDFNNCTAYYDDAHNNDLFIENSCNINLNNSNILFKSFNDVVLNFKNSRNLIGNLARKSFDLSSGSNYWSIIGGATASYPSIKYNNTYSSKITIPTGVKNVNVVNKIISSGGLGLNYFTNFPIGISFDIKATKKVLINGLLQGGNNFITTPYTEINTEWQHFSFNGITSKDISSATSLVGGFQVYDKDGLGCELYIANFRIWYGCFEEPKNYIENNDNRVILNKPLDCSVSDLSLLGGMYFKGGDIIRKNVSSNTPLDIIGWVVSTGGVYFNGLATRNNSTNYNVGDIVKLQDNATTYIALCVKSGTSSTDLGATDGENTFYTDGSVIWWLYYYGTTAILKNYGVLV